MNEKCSCGNMAISTKPMKYSPTDKYLECRRNILEKERKESGLI
jgi:rRNA maturation protein Nop10